LLTLIIDMIPKTILVIDDDLDILDAISTILDFEGFKVISSSKAAEIFMLINGCMPDLILLDVLLSGQDGRDIAKKLKTRRETKKIPIVMMSAHPTVSRDINNCKADGFIAKPFNIDYLLSTINSFFSNTQNFAR
jgi:DNA-binding response OmpR family regulator